MNNDGTYLSSRIYSYFTIIKEMECFCNDEEKKCSNGKENAAVLNRIRYYSRKSKRVGLDFFSEICSLKAMDIDMRLKILEQIQIHLLRARKMYDKFNEDETSKSYKEAITSLFLLRKQIIVFSKGCNGRNINTVTDNHHQKCIKQSLEFLESLKSYIHIQDIDICQN